MNKDLPNFLIVGTAKAATTTIHEYLKQHPDIYMTEWKEPSFFTFKGKIQTSYTTDRPVKFVTELNEYKSLFAKGEFKKIRGESSTPYLYFYKKTIDNIKETIPDYNKIKILIVLRNPIDRAFSQYMMKVRDLVENMSFKEAIENENKRKEENAHFDFFYIDRGLYFEQVKAYLENFNDVKVILYDDFISNDLGVLSEITSFLELKRMKFKKISKQNVSGRPKVKVISRLLKQNPIKRILSRIIPKRLKIEITSFILSKNLKKEKMDEEIREELIEFYREDINKLEKLLDKNLSRWLL